MRGYRRRSVGVDVHAICTRRAALPLVPPAARSVARRLLRYNAGFLFAIFLLIVAVRQTLLDIYPRPGQEYIGTAIFGLHMPVWSVVIALCLLIAYAVKLAAIGGNEHLRQYNIGTFPIIRLTQVVGLAAIDRAVFLKTTPLAEAPTFRRGRRHRQLLSVRQVLCRLRCCIVCRS
jgi:hypothetical protein